jgi:hypothetical protein
VDILTSIRPHLLLVLLILGSQEAYQHAQWRIAFIHHDFSHNIQEHILKPIHQIGLSTFVDDFMDYSHHLPD